MGKYFTVEVKPVIPATTNGLHAAFADGEILFDWTAFDVPKGACKLIGAHLEVRPKGDSGSTVNRFPLELLFAKSKRIDGAITAPSTLGVEGAAPVAPTNITLQSDTHLGHMPIVIGGFGEVNDSLAVSSTAAPDGMVLEGLPDSGTNVGYDKLYVGGIAGGAFNFVSSTVIDNGDLNGPTMTTGGTDPRLFIAVGDTVAACDATGTTAEIAMGTVASMTSTTVVLESAFTTGDVANADIVYNVSPVRILLTFEK